MMNNLPNQIRAVDRVDVTDDIIHHIAEYPDTLGVERTLEVAPYHWEDHMDINPITGEVHVDRLPNMKCRPENGEYFEFPFKVAASDGLNVTIQDAIFKVNHVVEPPTMFGQQTDFHVVEGENFSHMFTAMDPELRCHVENAVNPSFTVSDIPLIMGRDGTLSGIVPDNATPHVVTRAFTVTTKSEMSGLEAVLQCALHISNNNRGPAWTSPSAYSITPREWSDTLSATDREGDSVVFSLVSGMGFTVNGNIITRNFTSVGTYIATVRATDSRGAFTDLVITVQVNEFPNAAPVWVTPAGDVADVLAGSAFDFQLVATDTELVQYSLTGGALPTGLSMNSAGRITGNLAQVPEGSHRFGFTVAATDGVNSVPRSFAIRVTRGDRAPVWDTSGGTVFEFYPCQNISKQLVATDPEGAPVSYTASVPDSLSWLSVSPSGRMQGRVPLDIEVTSQAIPITVVASDGANTTPQVFHIHLRIIPPNTANFPSTADWQVPANVHQIMVHWLVGGGGGGGAGHEMGNGGGGAGAGSGGHQRRVAIDVVPNELLRFEIGAGGIGFSGSAGVTGYGSAGGITRILRGSQVLLSATGGGGGQTSPNFNRGYLTTAAGAGGSPNGIAGTSGQVGTNDSFSAVGGAGAHGPITGSQGGAGGVARGGGDYVSGPSAGKVGVGFGAGGGGGGSHDRINRTTNYWKGGNGVSGLIEITYPSIPSALYESDPNHPHYGMKEWTAPPSGGGGGDWGGGGGGGGSCAWVNAYLPSGKLVRDAQVGDKVVMLNKQGTGHYDGPVTAMKFDDQECWTLVTESGIELTISDTTPLITKVTNGYLTIPFDKDKIICEMVPVLDNGVFRWELVVDCIYAGVLPVGLLTANNGIYAAGNSPDRYIFTHNSDQKQLQ